MTPEAALENAALQLAQMERQLSEKPGVPALMERIAAQKAEIARLRRALRKKGAKA